MKVIDLLNKIAKGEEVPRKFTYNGYLWEYDINNKMWFYYFGKGKNYRFDKLFYLNMCLNDEVEILDKKTYSYKFKKDEKGCFTDKNGNRFSTIPVDEEDEFIDIEEITLNGEKLGYGGLSEWLGSKQTDNEVKLCSSIECLGVTLNDLIKNQKKIIQALKENK